MIKELIKLAGDLDRLGFHSEADFVDSKIQKLSAYIHGETGEELGSIVEDPTLSEEQIFRVRGPKSMPMPELEPELESKSTGEVDLDKPYFVLELVSTRNKNEIWKIHSSYDSRGKAKMEAHRLYDQAIDLGPENPDEIDFKPANQESVLNGLNDNTIIK